MARAVLGAAQVGYRHFDCAAVYGNEHLIGKVFEELLEGGLPRDELWVTSKLWNDKHSEPDVIPAFEQTLTDLRLDYLDLYLIHWPFPNSQPLGRDVTSPSPDARPYVHEHYMQVWQQLETLVDWGLVRHIGTSNMTIPKLESLLRDASVKPACAQMELHPHFQQPELFRFVVDHGIVPIGYCPVGAPNRPERDRSPDDTVDIDDPVIVEIAAAHAMQPAALCVRWAIQRGQAPIPMSSKRANYLSNLRAAVADPLTGQEMDAIAEIDRGSRLVRGQRFLWKDGQTWEDLWDPAG